jgi:hypothetical protein
MTQVPEDEDPFDQEDDASQLTQKLWNYRPVRRKTVDLSLTPKNFRQTLGSGRVDPTAKPPFGIGGSMGGKLPDGSAGGLGSSGTEGGLTGTKKSE